MQWPIFLRKEIFFVNGEKAVPSHFQDLEQTNEKTVPERPIRSGFGRNLQRGKKPTNLHGDSGIVGLAGAPEDQ